MILRTRGRSVILLSWIVSILTTANPTHAFSIRPFFSSPASSSSSWSSSRPHPSTTAKSLRITRMTATLDSSTENAGATDSTNTDTTATNMIWSQAQLEEYANQQGVVLSLTTLGPAYRAVARAKHNETMILGYVEGFVRPTGNLLHVDKMEVFRKMVKRARVENPQEFKGGGTFLGVGLLAGYLCLLHGQQCNCVDAEFLAIDDEERQHKRLVRYYKAAGFDFIKYVGDDFKDIPDRMVWGGCGTLMRKNISSLLTYWTMLMQKSLEKK